LKKRDVGESRTVSLRRYYGMTLDEYKALYSQQKGLCAICEESIRLYGTPGVKTMAHVDHDHRTGNVRALLCHSCNAGLGYFKDTPALLTKACKYLEKYQGAV
jgi:hypothetical protein